MSRTLFKHPFVSRTAKASAHCRGQKALELLRTSNATRDRLRPCGHGVCANDCARAHGAAGSLRRAWAVQASLAGNPNVRRGSGTRGPSRYRDGEDRMALFRETETQHGTVQRTAFEAFEAFDCGSCICGVEQIAECRLQTLLAPFSYSPRECNLLGSSQGSACSHFF